MCYVLTTIPLRLHAKNKINTEIQGDKTGDNLLLEPDPTIETIESFMNRFYVWNLLNIFRDTRHKKWRRAHLFCVVCFKTNSGKNVSECGVPVAALTVLKGDKYQNFWRVPSLWEEAGKEVENGVKVFPTLKKSSVSNISLSRVLVVDLLYHCYLQEAIRKPWWLSRLRQ